jgi:hypothetical protein
MNRWYVRDCAGRSDKIVSIIIETMPGLWDPV